jgi:hypothetical protein
MTVREAKNGIEGLALRLVLIAVSNDPESFKALIQGKAQMEKACLSPDINTRLLIELNNHRLNGKPQCIV